MSALLDEVRQSWRLLSAWKELRTDAGDVWLNAMHNPLGYGHAMVARLLAWAALVCVTLGAAASGVAFVLERVGRPMQGQFADLEGVTSGQIGLHVGWWGFTLFAALFMGTLAASVAKPGLRPTSFEVLRLPSRRAWLIVCWLRALPPLFGLGGLFAGGMWLANGYAWSIDLPARLGVLVLIPVLVGLAIGLCAALGIEAYWGLVGAFFVLYPSLMAVSSHASSGWTWLTLVGGLVLGGLLLAVQVWVVGWREPWALMQGAAAAAPARLVQAIGAPVGPLSWMRGRHGLFWSALYAELQTWRANGVVRLYWHLIAVFLLVQALEPALLEGLWRLLGLAEKFAWLDPFWRRAGPSGVPAVLAAVTIAVLHPLRFAGGEGPLPPRCEQLLYHLGADAASWQRFRWRTWWLSPLLFAGVVLTIAFGPTFERLGVLAVVVGALLLRAGWFEHPLMLSGRRLRLILPTLALLYAGLCYLVGPGLDWVFLVLGVAGLALAVLVNWPSPTASAWRGVRDSALWVGGGFAAAYGVYWGASRLPIWPSWPWAAALILLVVGLAWAIEQAVSCDEERLREERMVWGRYPEEDANARSSLSSTSATSASVMAAQKP